MNSNDEEALSSVYKKIQRERALLNAANQMRQQTQNEQVRSKIDTQMREGRRNIQYLEERMEELRLRTENKNQGLPNLGPQVTGLRSVGSEPPTPPPKDSRGGYIEAGTDRGGYGSPEYSQIGGHGDMMPPRHPYAPPGPGSGIPRSRPNYTKLGMFGVNTPSSFYVTDFYIYRSH